ncbi:SCP2 sterol-binding domain-containing protein [Xanthobacter dioxanivorans]|uniref:SCP2 sterol-binding domain-containing protein n=1 Tax=Xanthobacter dioxanivorans TaxID=2528964 RepID=A0A974PK81_9HYPH|nr:SCP2 sterol-binding domain-containing protein [Xanthobacter dioxanivorans]QRG05115.1 SCP2 sterol-binding domain-containing protein [Xanthobacter dioxanivorans]
MADLSSLVDAMRERSGALSELGYKVRFDLTDTGEAILLDATNGGVEVSEGAGEADAVLKLSTDTLDKLITGRIGPMLAFSTGRLKVEGSQGVALKLAGLLDPG